MVNIHIKTSNKKNVLVTTNRLLALEKIKKFSGGYSTDLYIKHKTNKEDVIRVSVGFLKEGKSFIEIIYLVDYYVAFKGIKDYEYNIYVEEWGVL